MTNEVCMPDWMSTKLHDKSHFTIILLERLGLIDLAHGLHWSNLQTVQPAAAKIKSTEWRAQLNGLLTE